MCGTCFYIFSAKKRKTPHENGPKEKTPKVEKESDKPLAQVPSVISTNMKSDSYNISQPPQFTPDLQSPYLPTSQNPSHLERLKNFYMLSAGYGNVLNLNAGTALTCLGSNNNTPTGALNLAIDANRSSPVSKSSARRKSKAINQQQSDKVITKIKEEDQTDIKTENSSQVYKWISFLSEKLSLVVNNCFMLHGQCNINLNAILWWPH